MARIIFVKLGEPKKQCRVTPRKPFLFLPYWLSLRGLLCRPRDLIYVWTQGRETKLDEQITTFGWHGKRK